MFGRNSAVSAWLVVIVPLFAMGQAPPGDNKPLLRLEAGGPTSNVTAMAFSPDGATLYAAGFDKVVRVWRLEAKEFKLDDKTYFRVPINPGTEGAINAIAVSPDGEWLAVGGLGVVRDAPGFAGTGRVWPIGTLTPERRQDMGLIYVFATKGKDVKMLRGHNDGILALHFAPARAGKPPLLVSAASGWNEQEQKRTYGEVLVWHIEENKILGKQRTLPPHDMGGSLPGLAAVHTGDKLNELRVAIAWNDRGPEETGKLRFWDLDQPGMNEQKLKNRKNNTVLTLLPERRLLAGSFLEQQGRLQVWNLQANPPSVAESVDLPAPKKSFYFPMGLTVFPSQGKQPPDHAAALVLQASDGQWQHRLLIMGLDNLGQAKANAPLWSFNGIGPVLAAAPRGGVVAVAGNDDHAIWVYAIADLLQGKNKPQQELHSVGATMRWVAFARDQQDRLGLAMSESAQKGQGPQGALPKNAVVFDFAGRELTDKVGGWKPARPDSGDWTIERSRGKDGVVVVRVFAGGQEVRSIRLPVKERVDAVALLAPQKPPLDVPLLAVAAYDVANGTPILDLYHARTGKHFRRYAGHSAPITSLAFSPDGRLLASAANDQTINVWSLTDIKEILNQHGFSGVTVVLKGKELVVSEVDEDSPARGQLAKGHVIKGSVGKDEKAQPLLSPRDFYETFWNAKPGQDVVLRIDDGNQVQNLALKADQGIDERKPLFSLFVTRADQGAREWLGWHALGEFDASKPAFERNLGVHFNTGQAKQPTKFAFIEEYRKQFFREGLLKILVDKGGIDLQQAHPKTRPVPQFDAVLGGVLEAGEVLIREPNLTLDLPIRDYTSEPDDQIEWQLNDGDAKPLGPPAKDLWPIPLELPGKAGQHSVRVRVRYKENGQQKEFLHGIKIRYQPPAPRVKYRQGTFYEETAAANFPFKFLVSAPGDGPDIRVALYVNQQKQKKPFETWDLARSPKDRELTCMLKLTEEHNLIEVVAENQGPLKDFEEKERHMLAVRVRLEPPAPAPTIAIQRIEPLEGEGAFWPFKPAQRITVDVPRVRIVGTITGSDQLQSGQWGLGLQAEAKPLDKFEPGKKKISFAQDVTLKPGQQTIRFFASTAKKDAKPETVAILYRPQLPGLRLEERPLSVIREARDKDKTAFEVKGQLTPPAIDSREKYDLKATIEVIDLASEKPILQLGPIKLKNTDRQLPPQTVDLPPGAYQVKVQLIHGDDLGGNPVRAEFPVNYVRPPRIVAVEAAPMGATAYVKLRAEVHSPKGLPPLTSTLKVKVNGRDQNVAKAQVGPEAAAGAWGKWELEVEKVPLDLGDSQQGKANIITLLVSNAEAISDLSKPIEVKPIFSKIPPPEIALEPLPSTLRDPVMAMKFRVQSAVPPKRVEVVVTGAYGQPREFPAKQLKERDPGDYEFSVDSLSLQPGLNQLQVVAANDGGQKVSKPHFVSVLTMPVELTFDALRVGEPGGPVLRPRIKDGVMEFPRVLRGQVVLEGKVHWLGQRDDLLAKDHKVRIYVNGFLQVPAVLKPAKNGVRERRFEAQLALNLQGANHIEVDLPTLQQEGSNLKECKVACANPVEKPHLHVLVLAPEIKQTKARPPMWGEGLKGSIAKALNASRIEQDRYQTKIYDQVHLYLLTSYVEYSTVTQKLGEIQHRLRVRAAQGSPHDVVMFYYLGEEMLRPAGRLLKTSEPNRPFPFSDYLAEVTGAKMLFLDLQPGGTTPVAWRKEESRLALFRHLQPAGAQDQSQLLQGLEKAMPSAKVTWLHQLPVILEQQLTLAHYHPKGMKLRINPDPPGQ